jgi:NitT/TauT family transport system substrate-binding protein
MGRRAIVTYAAVVVRPTSEVYTAQQLAGRSVGVPFYAGTHYLALHLLSGFLNRDLINIVPGPTGSRHRLDAMLSGAVEATTLTEPYISLAEKKGCRSVCAGFYHGTEVASKNVDAETYSRFNAAVKEAVRRITSDKRKYMSYFIDYHKEHDSELLSLSIDDLRPERLVVCDPAPIPDDELQRTYDWIKSWGMLADIGSPLQLVDTTA